MKSAKSQIECQIAANTSIGGPPLSADMMVRHQTENDHSLGNWRTWSKNGRKKKKKKKRIYLGIILFDPSNSCKLCKTRQGHRIVPQRIFISGHCVF